MVTIYCMLIALGTALSGGKAIMARKKYLLALYIIYVFEIEFLQK